MLALIGHAIVSALYIPSYQHIYAQTPSALYLGPSDSPVAKLLDGEGYSVTPAASLPSELSGFNVVVLDADLGSLASFDLLEDYVEGGGGLVYLAGAAESLNLADNSDWLGAASIIHTGAGENATVIFDSPFESGLLANDSLMLQTVNQSGALGVDNLAATAQSMAQYTSGAVFAYSYEDVGRVYFQAYADPGVGDSMVEDNVEDLLLAGMIWSTSETEQFVDVLPLDTEKETGHNRPSGSIDIVFSEPGPDAIDVTVPTDPTASIFVTADAGLTNPVLYFEADGQQYQYRVQIDKGTLLTFPSPLTLSNARFEVDGWTSGMGRVGYVTLRTPPACILPAGATMTDGSIPSDATAVGSTDFLGSVAIPSPTAPVTSVIVGLDASVSGYVLNFATLAGQFECPIQPEVIEIEFSEPTVISDAAVENDGPWGLIGYIENLGSATIYAKYAELPKGTVLPSGITVEPGAVAPTQVHSADFSLAPEIISLTEPTKKVISLWVSADADLVDPYVYFSRGSNWYAIAIEQSSSSLFSFPTSIEIDEIYASASATSQGSIAVGYAHPILAKARAGSDQTVQEEQSVYLDGRASAGQGAISFKWSQIEGPSVTIQNSDSAQASFGAPQVDEAGARLGFKLVVTDSEGAVASDIIVVNIKNEKVPNNLPPVIGAIPGASVNEGVHVVLAASAFDADGDTLKYTWTQISGPAADLSGEKTSTLSFDAPQVSEDSALIFEIKVADGLGHVTTKDVLVTVLEVPGEVVVPEPALSGGNDQTVLEGSTVFLAGEYQGDAAEDIRWEQTGGITVTLDNISPLAASFIAPQINQDSSTLTFRMALYSADGTIGRWDDVSITVNNTAQVQIVEEIDPTLQVKEPSFSAVERIDAKPPALIHQLGILGTGSATVPDPDGPVTGIWINATSEMSGLGLHFSSSGRKYSISAESDRPTAYVFDRQIGIQGINLTAPAGIEQVGIGYYYDQIPLVPAASPAAETTPELEVIPPIEVTPPQEGAIIKFARENQIIAGTMAIAVPVGIGVGLKMASNHHRKAKSGNPARTLFPKNDPVAGEAEKVKPVIEELEKMLGRNLDTALNASELLDKFGSGRTEATQR